MRDLAGIIDGRDGGRKESEGVEKDAQVVRAS